MRAWMDRIVHHNGLESPSIAGCGEDMLRQVGGDAAIGGSGTAEP